MPRLLSDSDSDSDSDTMQSQPSTSSLACPPAMYPTVFPLINSQSMIMNMAYPMVMRDDSGNMIPTSAPQVDPENSFVLIPTKDLLSYPVLTAAEVMKRYKNNILLPQSKSNGCCIEEFEETTIKTENVNDKKLVILDKKVPVVKLTRFDHCVRNKIKDSKQPLRLMQPVISLERMDALKEHYLMKSDPKCCLCQKTFVTPKGMIMHARIKHNNDQIFICDHCGRSFLFKKTLEMHHKLKHPDSLLRTERSKSESSSDFGSSRASSGLSCKSVSVCLHKLEDEDIRMSDDSEVSITKVVKVSKKIEEIDLEDDFEEVDSPEVSNKEDPDFEEILSDSKDEEEEVTSPPARRKGRARKRSLSSSDKSESEDKSQNKSESEDKSQNKSESEDKSQNESELEDKSQNESELEDKSQNKDHQPDPEPETKNSEEELKEEKPKACPKSKKKKLPMKNSDMPPAKKSKLSKSLESKEEKSEEKNKPKLDSIFRTDEALCENCNKIKRRGEMIYGDTDGEDLNDVQAKCESCPEILHFRVEFETHNSSMHLPCLNETSCIITNDSQSPPEQFYKCSQCGIRFVEQRYLDIHKISVHGEHKPNRKYTCFHCPAEFSGNDHYYNHFMAQHSSEEKAPVEVTRDNYVRMQNSESKDEKFVCSVCNANFEDRQGLSLHYEDSHTNYSSMCSTCQAAFRTKNETLEHVLTHEGVQTYIVLFKFYNANGLSRSLNGNVESLDETGVETEAETEMETEGETKVGTEMETEVETKVGTEMETEMETEVETKVETEVESPKKEEVKKDEPPKMNGTICKRCDRSFDSSELYEQHGYYFHDAEMDAELLRPQNDVLLPTTDSGTTVVKELLGAVEVVEDQKPLEESEKDVPEKIIGISSMVEDLDSEEVMTCEEASELSCPICSENFEMREDLNLHLYLTHEDARGAHVCENCKKILTSIQSVNEHRCTLVDTFRCEYCKTSYENAELLYRHNNKKHLETGGMTVCFCGRMFMTNRMLSYHVKTEHVPIVEVTEKDNTPPEEYVSQSEATVHIIPIENEQLDYEDQVLELDKILDLEEFEKVHSEIKVDCSYPRRASYQNYCPFCKSEINEKVTIDEHFEEKHALNRETCQLCHTRFNLPRETLHFMKHHMKRCLTYTPRSRPKKTSVEKLAYDFIHALSPSSIMSIFLYRLQSDRFMATNQCIICEEDFADLGNCLQHFVNFHDKMCVLCNQVFVTADLAETHKKRHHVSYEAYLWFVLRSANYFANVVTAKEYRSFMPCLCRVLGISHELLVESSKQFAHTDDCKNYTDTRTIIQLMKECVEDFGQVKSETRMILLVLDEIFNKYQKNVDEMARSISENSRQFTLDQIKQILENYLQSLK